MTPEYDSKHNLTFFNPF